MKWSNYFSSLNDGDKRLLLDFPINAFTMFRKKYSNPGETSQEIHVPAAPNEAMALIKNLNVQDFDNLTFIRSLSDDADASTYPHDIEIYKQVLKHAPWDSITIMSIASSHWNAGDKRKGIEWMKKAHKVDPKNKRIENSLNGMILKNFW